MRILLTDQGKDLLSLLSVEQDIDKNVIQTEQSKSLIKSHNSIINFSRNYNRTNESSSMSKNASFENTKHLDLKMKKLQISKNISDKYNNDTSKTHILINLPDLLQKRIEENFILKSDKTGKIDDSNYLSDFQFSIKDILPQSSYQNLKKELDKDIGIKNKLEIIDETKFRSIFHDKTDHQILEEKLKKKIGMDRLNLIKYLSNKQFIKYQFLQKMTSYNDERLNKINKICHKVFENDEKNELFSKIIEEKMSLKKIKDVSDYKDELDKLSNNISSANKIENNYSLPKDVRINKFSSIHEDWRKKFWSKNSIEKLSRNKWLPKISNNTESHFG